VSKIVIFGTRDIAELAHYYFSTDSQHTVCAFTVDAEYLTEAVFCKAPVIPFNEIANHFPPPDYRMFIALSYKQINKLRREKFDAAATLGYELVSFVSSKASVASNVSWGSNCFVLENCVLQPFVRLGDNVTIWSGSHIGHHATIKDNCFITSQVVISGGVTVGENCFIGVNATLRDHINIGARCIIGAGALILDDTTAESVYLGPRAAKSPVPSSRIRSI